MKKKLTREEWERLVEKEEEEAEKEYKRIEKLCAKLPSKISLKERLGHAKKAFNIPKKHSGKK